MCLRKDAPAQRSIINLGAYVTMFPQLIAGPIVRYQTVAEQLTHRKETQSLFASGVERFIIGLGKKYYLLIISDYYGTKFQLWTYLN